jgi:SNF2 family DNA or RNA helicase
MSNRRLETTLLPYQKDAVKWCINHENECCIIAYDMGLGKTVITCAVLVEKPMKTMIILPNSLINQWKSELDKHTSGMKIMIYHDQKRKRSFNEFEESDIILTTSAVLANDIRDGVHHLQSIQRWVIDESHKLRNKNGKIYKELLQFAPLIRNKIFLTGTPICNNPDDLISIICLSNIDYYNDPTLWKQRSFTSKMELLENIMPNILSRKTKEGTIVLPKIHFHDFTLDVESEEQKETYNSFVLDEFILRRILRMRQSLNNHKDLLEKPSKDVSIKIQTVNKIISQIPKTEKIIIFSNFTSLLKYMYQSLSVPKESIQLYHGEMNMESKSNVIEQFKQDPNARILLINLKAGSCGLNLIEANHVILMEPYWNDSETQQAINRLYRIGQQREVHVYNIQVKNSIELWLKNMQLLKCNISKKLIDNNTDILLSDIESDGMKLKRLFKCVGNVNLIANDDELQEMLEEDLL